MKADGGLGGDGISTIAMRFFNWLWFKDKCPHDRHMSMSRRACGACIDQVQMAFKNAAKLERDIHLN